MKNLTLLRLAGFGLFGVTFVSPVSIEKKHWILNELACGQILPDLPFRSSAFCQETSYPKRSDPTTIVINQLSEIISPDTTASKIEEPTAVIQQKERLLQKRKQPPKKTEHREKIQTNPTAVSVPWNQSIPDDSITPEIGGTEPADPLLSSIDTASTIENEEEILQPPTEYVDEVKQISSYTTMKSIIPIISRSTEAGLADYPKSLLANRIATVSRLSGKLGYSTKYAFLLNLGLKSGKKRFLIVDLENKSIIAGGLVAHGRGKEKFTLNKKYSNTYGSSCSSLGLYKIGAAYNGDFGKSFRLIGLEKTNNNALIRAIVLHSMGCIPDEEIDYPICQSEGCPSVSPGFLQTISTIIKSTDKPILLWAFDPAVDENMFP